MFINQVAVIKIYFQAKNIIKKKGDALWLI